MILFVVLPVLLLLDRRKQGQRPGPHFVQAIAILLFGLAVLNAGYGFERSFASLGSFEFTSDLLTGEENARAGRRRLGNIFTGSIAGHVPVPLPANFVQGVDLQCREVETRPQCFLGGQWKSGGWWYYYLYASAVKLPIGTLFLFGLALTIRVVKGRLASASDELFLLVPAIALIVLLSACTGLNRYFRYLIPALPFLYIWASSAASTLNGPKVIGCSLLFLAMAVGSCLRAVPHTMSYFNEFAGGPIGGRHHLADANIDWGQDLLFLKTWLETHGRDRKLHLAYFGTLQPELLGFRYAMPPFGPVDDLDGAFLGAGQLGPQPGLHAVSVNFLMGYEASAPNGSGGHLEVPAFRYSYFDHFTPVGMAGYSIYIYDLTPAEVNRVRRKLGLPELEGQF